MLYHRKKCHHRPYGYLFATLGIVAAFIIGRKSEQWGYTIVTRECWGSNDENKKVDADWDEPPGDPVGA